MKRIIDGLSYNTKTAETIAGTDHYNNGNYQGTETLYKTAKGAYFIALESLPRDADTLVPVSSYEAFQWCQESCAIDYGDWEDEFKDMIGEA